MRPKQLLKDNTLYWVLNTYNPATGILADADSTPTVAVRKNGASVGDSVTVTKRSATTGIYDCSYNPAGEVEGDQFTIVETVVMSSVTYVLPWEFSVLASVGAGGLDAAGVRSAIGMASANMDTQLSGISDKTTNLPSDPADQSAVDGLIVAAVVAIRGADDDTLKTLSDQIDGVGSGTGTGTGARTIVVTVNDGTTVLQNAAVRLTEGASSFKGLTNVSGVVTFNVDDATYTVGITKGGYSYAGTTLVVDGTEAVTYSMTANSSTPPDDPALCAVTIHVFDQYGDDMADEPVEITFVRWDDAATDTPPVLSVPPVQTTDADGLVSVNLFREAVYKIVYGTAPYTRRVDVTIPDAGSYSVEI